MNQLDYNTGLMDGCCNDNIIQIKSMIKAGANNFIHYNCTENFSIYKLYLKYYPVNLHHYKKLLVKSPEYFLMINKNNSNLRKLPYEIFGILFKY